MKQMRKKLTNLAGHLLSNSEGKDALFVYKSKVRHFSIPVIKYYY